MTPTDFDPDAFKESDPTFEESDPPGWIMWPQYSHGAINLPFAPATTRFSSHYVSSQDGMTPQSIPQMNVASNTSFATLDSTSNLLSNNNENRGSGDIAHQPLHYHASYQLNQHNAYSPSTDDARSYNDGHNSGQHGTISSGYSNLDMHQNINRSDLDITPGYSSYDDLGNFYPPSAPGSVQPSVSTTQTHALGSSISGTPSNYFQISSDSQVPQSTESRRPTQLEQQFGGTFLGVQIQDPGSFDCVYCGQAVRTASEHRKHLARHEKPHKCKYPSCEYASATINDLVRHTRCKHIVSLRDRRPAKRHSCSLEPCKSQARTFSRLDNFRNHLRKKHNLDEDEVKRFVQGCSANPSDVAPQRPRIRTGAAYRRPANYDSTMGPRHQNTAEQLTSNIGGFTETYPLDQVLFPAQQIILETQALGALLPEPATLEGAAYGAWTPRGGQIGGMIGGWHQETPQINIPTMLSDFSHIDNTPMISQNSSEIGSLYHTSNVESLRENAKAAGYKLVPDSRPDSPSNLPPRRTNTRKEKREHPYAFDDNCPKCRYLGEGGPRKVASLNKHIENAALIFFCTDGCADHARIGKKESWYRHENSSHWKFEKWRCSLKTSPGQRNVCGFESNFSHSFKKHLRDNHPTFRCPRGRRSDDIGLFRISNEEFGVIFWCGFCQKHYRMSGNADERVQARLDHVEYHLKGRHGWDRGTVRTWSRKPEGEPLLHMVEPLDCRQSRAIIAQRKQNGSCSTLARTSQRSSSPPADLPVISVTHAQAQPAAVAPQHLSIDEQQGPSMEPSSISRLRRSTTSLTCCQCGEHHFDANTCVSCYSLGCGHVFMGCENCKIEIGSGKERRRKIAA